jgi:hypothetical protein
VLETKKPRRKELAHREKGKSIDEDNASVAATMQIILMV